MDGAITDSPPRRFPGRDGTELAWREIGDGRPVVPLHGLMGSGSLLAGSGLAQALARHGYRVILPDLRGHGDSARPARAVVGGQGLDALDAESAGWIAQTGTDPRAVSLVLDSSAATPREALAQVPAPVNPGDSRAGPWDREAIVHRASR